MPSKRSILRMSQQDNYSREIRLREEAESPFRKVRFLVYASLLGGAFTSLAVSAARIAAALAGINADLLEESSINAAVDIGGIAIVGYLFKRDLDSQESRLKRAAKGAEFAKLAIRSSADLLAGAEGASTSSVSGKTSITAPLSSLRRGRGVEKRVVIAAAGKEKIREVLEEAKDIAGSLVANDLVIVPIVLPQCTAPLGLEIDLIEQDSVALPAGGNWKDVVGDEAAKARGQGVDVESDGFCIILKKNGRVGQRTRGIFIGRMVGEVVERREMGMDVTNI